jgi:hypothetical protein
MGKVIQLEPTTKATVNSNASFGFSCSVKLSDSEKILVDITTRSYDYAQNSWVENNEKAQLEELHYHTWGGAVTLSSMVVRGFRKDGALRFRTTYVSQKDTTNVLKHIPAHYHDYAKEAFKKDMAKLQTELTKTINKGVQL